MRAFGDAWFEEIRRYSYRDQIPLSYLTWKTGFAVTKFPGFSVDDSLFLWPDFDGPRLPRGFDDQIYLNLHPDVAASGISPREHYMKHGLQEGRAYR